jgi:hypothetical protein
MRPVQCAPRGSSYAISHESQSCVLSLPVRLALLRVACWGDCVVRGHEHGGDRERQRATGFRFRYAYGTGRSSRRDKTIRCTTCVFVFCVFEYRGLAPDFVMHHLHVRRYPPDESYAGPVSVVPCLCVLKRSFVD